MAEDLFASTTPTTSDYNASSIEVLEGLEPGEKVLTSPYTGFTDKDRLDLTK